MRKVTEDFIGTCQWCLGEYKVNSNKEIVLHGYQRPGYGYTVGNCQGIYHPPFEYDYELTKQRISYEEAQITDFKNKIPQIQKAKKLPNRFYKKDSLEEEFIYPDNPHFDHTKRILVANCEGMIRYIERMVDYLKSVVNTWEKKAIVGIDLPPTGREKVLRPAYDPDKDDQRKKLEIERAIREAKPGKLYINFYYELSYPSDEETRTDNNKWFAAMTHLDDIEKQNKIKVKNHFAKLFDGKIRIADGDTLGLSRIDNTLSKHARHVVISVSLEWHHRDHLIELYPDAVFKVRSNKEIRMFIPLDKM